MRETIRFPLVADGTGEVETFIAAIRRLSRAQNLNEVAATAATAARRLLSADGITFVLRDGERCYYADEDAISPLWKGKRFPMEACISGWCMLQGERVVISNIYEDERIPHDAYRPTFVRSLAMVPVRQDDPLAAMGAYWSDERVVSDDEVELLQTMADAAALAIANVELAMHDTQSDLLQRELSHRIKNIFTVALSLARLTEGDTVAEYKDALTSRLAALEHAHATTFESGEAVGVKELLRKLLVPSRRRISLQCTFSDVRLSASDAADLALFINELDTNALKYGALTVPEGRVDVTCEQTPVGLRLRWKETGGPQVSPPTRHGFGTTMMQAIVDQKNGGKVSFDFLPEGLECNLLLPLEKQTESFAD